MKGLLTILIAGFFISTSVYAQRDTTNQCQSFADAIQGSMLPMDITGNVCTVAKSRPVSVTINGIPTKSPLVNSALFSYENGLNLGETAALPSEIEKFRDQLHKKGMKITAIHTHWLGTDVSGKPTVLMYIHWMDTTMDPIAFAKAVKDAWDVSFGGNRTYQKTNTTDTTDTITNTTETTVTTPSTPATPTSTNTTDMNHMNHSTTPTSTGY